MPTWAKLILEVDFQPVRIVFDTKRKHGVTLVNSESTVKVKIRGIRLGVLKVTLKMYALLRWDCTKPTNLYQRLFYNTQYDDGKPGHDFNKVFYKFRVRVEYKVKKIPCFCSGAVGAKISLTSRVIFIVVRNPAIVKFQDRYRKLVKEIRVEEAKFTRDILQGTVTAK